jgi:hypothetical protein
MLLGALQWSASVGTVPLLAADDETLRAWFNRCSALYGAAGPDVRMKPLFA